MSIFGRRVSPESVAAELLESLQRGEISFEEEVVGSEATTCPTRPDAETQRDQRLQFSFTSVPIWSAVDAPVVKCGGPCLTVNG